MTHNNILFLNQKAKIYIWKIKDLALSLAKIIPSLHKVFAFGGNTERGCLCPSIWIYSQGREGYFPGKV